MRGLACLFLTSVSLICIAGSAEADIPWYVAGDAGASLRMDASRSTTFSNKTGTTGPGTNKVTFDTGPAVYLEVGYRLPNHLRVEGELGYSQDSVSSASPLSLNGAFPALVGARLPLQSGGGRNNYSATINAFYDMPVSEQFIPYVGAGIGVDDLAAATAHFGEPGARPIFTEDGGQIMNAAILGEAGVAIALNNRWPIIPAYRYEHIFTTGTAFRNDANILKLGVRRSF